MPRQRERKAMFKLGLNSLMERKKRRKGNERNGKHSIAMASVEEKVRAVPFDSQEGQL